MKGGGGGGENLKKKKDSFLKKGDCKKFNMKFK